MVIGVIGGYFSTIEAISIVPSTVKLSIIPGESKSGVFEVQNSEKGDIYVELFVKDWILENNNRKFAPPGSSSSSLSEWITFEEESFRIAQGQKRKIRYVVEIPEKAEGGHWGLVCFKSLPLKTDGGGIKVATQLVSFVGIEVEGTLKRKVEIGEVLAKHIKDKGFILKAKLKNLGNTPLFQPSPRGMFKIKDKNDNILAEGELEGLMILPEEIGEYTSKPFQLNNKGEYEMIITFDYGEPKLIGRKVILPANDFYDWKVLEKVVSKK